MKKIKNTVIVGGGLSGLTLAYLLSKKGMHCKILEASDRLGGRIQTVKGTLETPLELGATWFSDAHLNLISMLDELGIQKFSQFSKGISLFQTSKFEPPQKFEVSQNESPSYRVEGGTQTIINTLVEKLNRDHIVLNSKVVAIKEEGENINVITSNNRLFKADRVIICLPPQLVASQIHFSPALDDALIDVLPTVQTWMAGSIKFALEYAEPFWRKKGFSGMLYSHTGIVAEMYDHTNSEENKFGFTGFLNGGATAFSQEIRRNEVLKQLATLLGDEAQNPIAYFDKIWTDEFIRSGNPVIHRPHQNNGHPLLQKSYLNNKLLFSGTETASEFGGYMEGAIISAQRIFKSVVQ